MKWLIYYFLLVTVALWPLEHFTKIDLTEPLVFTASYLALLFLGWIISYFINRSYFFKIPKLVAFIGYFIIESIKSNLWVAYDILTPKWHLNPAIVSIPLDIKTDFEINTLASLITLTPGTLSLEVSDDRKILYVHMMYVRDDDVESARKDIKNGFEKRIIELTA
jgi:multicomponent Na+:H+ antiporter subunit E